MADVGLDFGQAQTVLLYSTAPSVAFCKPCNGPQTTGAGFGLRAKPNPGIWFGHRSYLLVIIPGQNLYIIAQYIEAGNIVKYRFGYPCRYHMLVSVYFPVLSL